MTLDPQDRSAAVLGLMESMGGRLVGFYHSFGEYDGVITSSLPTIPRPPPVSWRSFRPDISR